MQLFSYFYHFGGKVVEEAEVMEQRETDVLVDLGFDVPYPDRNYTPQPLA